jgi:hypothetical protein
MFCFFVPATRRGGSSPRFCPRRPARSFGNRATVDEIGRLRVVPGEDRHDFGRRNRPVGRDPPADAEDGGAVTDAGENQP